MPPYISDTGRGELPAHSDILGTRYVSHHSGLSVWPRTSVVVNGMCTAVSVPVDLSYVVVLPSLHLQTWLTVAPLSRVCVPRMSQELLSRCSEA